MPVYDISVPVRNGMHVWPSDPGIALERTRHPSADGSHTIQVTTLRFGSHTGTHLDTPIHMMGADAPTLDDIPIERFLGPARVVALPGVRSIGRRDLERANWDGVARVLFKTDNSDHWHDSDFFENFVYLEPEGATFLVERKIQLVGIDYLSIDRFDSEAHPTHFVLLGRSVVILEGINLTDVPPGDYELIALPIKLSGADGAPVRAILRN